MRLIFLCTAVCIASSTCPVSSEYSPEANSLTGMTSATAANLTPPISDVAVLSPISPVGAIPSEQPIVQPPLQEIEGEPSETSGSNAYARDPKKFTKIELCSAAASVAAANNLPIPFFANLIQQESGFKPHVVSSAGAQGIAQFMPRVAASYGLADPFEPVAALKASAKLLADLVSQFGNLGLAAAAYNAGPKRIQDWIVRRRPLPAETRHYVHSITGRPAEQWAGRGLNNTEARLPPHDHCPDLPAIVSQDRPDNPISQIASSAKRETPFLGAVSGRVSTIQVRLPIVRRAMPQPSQFAMGLPVSRFEMAKPIGVIGKKEGSDGRLTVRMKTRRQPLMTRFAAVATPIIMVEEKAPARLQPLQANSRRKTITPNLTIASKAVTKIPARRMRLAAAH